MRATIVVPTHRRPESLKATLEGLLGQESPGSRYEIVVVDDAADPEASAVVKGLMGGPVEVRLINQRSLGAAAARNAGASAARGDLLIFCDDDFGVETDHVAKHVATHERQGDILLGGDWWYSPDALAALMATPFGRFRIEFERRLRDAREESRIDRGCVEVDTLSACDLSIRAETFWRLGGFDADFPYAGTEDQDFSLRARKAGYRLLRNREIRPFHNDPHATLRQFCAREARGAESVVVLGRKHPEAIGDFARLAPVSREDGPSLIAVKLLKRALSGDLQLRAIHGMVDQLERLGVSDSRLYGIYRRVIGLYLFKGYRKAFEVA
jgi:GT2 family glycosyltransferase